MELIKREIDFERAPRGRTEQSEVRIPSPIDRKFGVCPPQIKLFRNEWNETHNQRLDG